MHPYIEPHIQLYKHKPSSTLVCGNFDRERERERIMPRNTDPSFFKVLSCWDFKNILRLPPAFVTKYEVDPSGSKQLMSHSGKKWKVKVEGMGKNGIFCFTQGWQSFAADAALQLGEFLFFTRVTESEFVVQIFATNFCERQIPPPALSSVKLNLRAPPKPRNDDVVGVSKTSSGSPIYFKACLQNCHKSRMYVPKGFAVAAKLEEKGEVRLEFGPGQRGTSVVVGLCNKYNRTELVKGWPKFRTMNGLVIGKTYSFELKPNHHVIHVKEVIGNLA